MKQGLKHVIIVPPSGRLKRQDFALGRISKYLQSKNFTVSLLHIPNDINDAQEIEVDYLISVTSEDNIINYLHENECDLIFHRTWMHSYYFASILADNFSNIIFYIKDWMVEMSREEYKSQFKTDDDYDGIKKLFTSKHKILSHYHKEYTKRAWSKEYKVDSNKFIFFPEYTDERHYHEKRNIIYDINDIKLLEVGGLMPSSEFNNFANSKSFLENINIITKQKIIFHKMVLPYLYKRIFESENYDTYVKENKNNKYFSIILGGNMNTYATDEYHFAIYPNLYVLDDTKEYTSLKYTSLSKFTYYLEAGLPIIINEYFVLSKIIKEHKIGIVVSNEDAKNLKSVLSITSEEYNELLENIKVFREEYSYNDKTMSVVMDLLNA